MITWFVILQTRGGLQAPMSAAAPSLTALPNSSSRLQAIHSAHAKPSSSSALNRNRCLPPVATSQKPNPPPLPTASTSTEHDYAAKPITDNARTIKQQSAQQVNSSMLSELTIPKPPSEARSAHHDRSQRLHHPGLLTAAALPPTEITGSGGTVTKSYSGKSLRRTDSEKSLKKQDINSIPENSAAEITQPVASASGTSRQVKRKDGVSLEKLKGTLRGPANPAGVSAAEIPAGASGSTTPHLVRRASSRQHEVRASSRQHADLTLETIKDSFCSQRITLESLSSNEAKVMSGLLQQASLEKLGSSSISSFSPVRTRKPVGAVLSGGGGGGAAGASSMSYSNYHTVEDIGGNRSAKVCTPILIYCAAEYLLIQLISPAQCEIKMLMQNLHSNNSLH